MSEKILFVDDEPNILSAIQRQLHRQYDVEVAEGAEAGLRAVEAGGPFAVVVSDMKMPVMNGAEFLGRVRAAAPDSVRMILSGQSELAATIDAVNRGHIYRFLTKPCPPEALRQALDAGLEQFRLVHAERELLERTLGGMVRLLTEILSLTNPEAFVRTARVRQYVEQVVERLGLSDPWQYRIAAMLSQLGTVSLPGDIVGRVQAGAELEEEEQELYRGHPALGGKLLAQVPRLETVAKMVAGQATPVPAERRAETLAGWPPEDLGAELLRTVAEFDLALGRGGEQAAVVDAMAGGDDPHLREILDVLRDVEVAGNRMEPSMLCVADLKTSMVLDQDLRSHNGLLLVPKNTEINKTLLDRLHSFARGVGVVEPFRVLVPR